MNEYVHLSSHEMETEETNEINFHVLHPENPLMIRFQNALSQMLTKKLECFEEDLMHTQNELKKNRQEKEDLCEILYNQKSELLKLENSVNNYNEIISRIVEKRDLLQTNLARSSGNNQEELQVLNDERTRNHNLRQKTEIQSSVLKQLKKYEQDEAINLQIIKQAISRNKADQVTHLKEKIRKDCLLMKLENEVFKQELRMKSCREQIDSQNENLVKLQKNLASKNFVHESILQDNSQLLKVWKHMVFLICKRDEEYSSLKLQSEKAEILYKEKIIEMNSFKGSGEKEMLRNEILTVDKDRKISFSNDLERQQIKMNRKLLITEHELQDLNDMIECTQNILKRTEQTQMDNEKDLLLVENKLKKITNEKYELEENIISQLQNELISNNATAKLNEDICKLRHASLQLELQIKELNTNYFETCATLEKHISVLDADRSSLENKKIDIREKEEETLKLEKELENTELQTKKEENRLEDYCKQLHKLTEQPNAHPELEEKESHIVARLKSILGETEDKKHLWVQKQNEIMSLMEKRTQCTSELNLLDQHLNILRQKNIKIDQILKNSNEDTARLDKTISHMLDYISRLNNECNNQKQYENTLNSENCTIQNKATEKLQEAENEIFVIVQEMDHLKSKKEFSEEELMNVQRKGLEWEKKVKMANEMKQEIIAEQSEKGDIGRMKNEIHRMEIRYAQLKKAQESLITNFETCVSKRDRIFDDVSKDSKKTDILKQQQMMIRHINIIRSKNLKLKEKLETLEQEFYSLCAEKQKLSDETKNCDVQIQTLQHEIKELDEKIRSHHLLKHKNLEILIRKQKFADFLSQIESGRKKVAPVNDSVPERDFMRHQYLRQDLLDTMELLKKDYPKYQDEIIRITNILQSYCEK